MTEPAPDQSRSWRPGAPGLALAGLPFPFPQECAARGLGLGAAAG